MHKVYNFFIKKCTALHEKIAETVERTVRVLEKAPQWLYTGTTYLVPKTEKPETAGEYRPITCMTNLYKVVTRLVMQELGDCVDVNKILSSNQLGTIRDSQGAEEQALINKCLHASHVTSCRRCGYRCRRRTTR